MAFQLEGEKAGEGRRASICGAGRGREWKLCLLTPRESASPLTRLALRSCNGCGDVLLLPLRGRADGREAVRRVCWWRVEALGAKEASPATEEAAEKDCGVVGGLAAPAWCSAWGLELLFHRIDEVLRGGKAGSVRSRGHKE
jgi:hypothetical protein